MILGLDCARPRAENSINKSFFQVCNEHAEQKMMLQSSFLQAMFIQKTRGTQNVFIGGFEIGVYIDDVLLGTDDADDHLRLVEEFLRTSEECNTRVKLEKCEFMQEKIEYLGFQVGWRWWRPVKEKVAPILKASICDDKTRGVKDIRAFLGSCNFYRRHIPTFTYSSHLLTDLTKKTVPWKWTPEHEAQFQEIKEKLSSLRLLGTPEPDGEFLVITDASLVGGGGTLLQWQRITGAAAKRIADDLKTVGVNRDGSHQIQTHASGRVKCNLLLQCCKTKYLEKQVRQIVTNSATFADVLVALERQYPTYETDLSIRAEIQSLPVLPNNPKPGRVSELLADLDH